MATWLGSGQWDVSESCRNLWDAAAWWARAVLVFLLRSRLASCLEGWCDSWGSSNSLSSRGRYGTGMRMRRTTEEKARGAPDPWWYCGAARASRDLRPLEFSLCVKEKRLFCSSLFIAYVTYIVLTCSIRFKASLKHQAFIFAPFRRQSLWNTLILSCLFKPSM